MKIVKYLIACSLIAMMAVSCDKGLDPIVPVNPKPDVSAPVLEITFPEEGGTVVSPDSIATITLKMIAEDDVELKSVVIQLDGTEIANFTEFTDYRRLDLEYDQGGMLDGDFTLTVIVTDLTDKSVTKSVNFSKITAPPYTPLEGEVLYFSFDGFFLDLITKNSATVTGTPGFASGKVNDAYAGAAGAYIEYPTTGLLGAEFGLSFWYKINADPLRAGVMAISQPTDPLAADRTKGFRFLRENNGANQNIGINFGIGTTEVWMNPFITVPPDQDWMHIAISISATKATIYVNGEIAPLNGEVELASGIDWTGCTSLTIASGMPNFIYWEHFSDLSLYDEVHLFNRAITAEEVQAFYQAK